MSDREKDMADHGHGYDAHANRPARGGEVPPDRLPVADPVCGMKVDPATSEHRLEHAR
jgi:P-type Cu+ transporter